MNEKTDDVSLNAQLHKIKQLIKKQRLIQAEEHCRLTLKNYLDHPQVSQLLLNILYQRRQFELLINQFNNQQKLFINSASALSLYANALRYCEQGERALQVLNDFLDNNPDNYQILNQIGLINKELGIKTEAIKAFEKCVKIKPDFSQAYWHKSTLSKQLDPQEVNIITEKLFSNISNRDKAFLHYALFTHYDSIQDYESAINHLNSGAKIQRRNLNYSHVNACAEYDNIIKTFTSEFLQKNDMFQQVNIRANQRSSSNITPIFIIGMPRSGSTLVEQVIASHSLVTGGDESHDFVRATEIVLTDKNIKAAYPDWLLDINKPMLQSISNHYMQLSSRLHKTPYFTDKTLFNFKALGLILSAFPNAKIINTVRNSLDNIFGCYKQLFANGLGFTYDLEELADHFIMYEKLMSHWRRLFGNRIFTLKYEHLINEQLKVTQNLLNFIGLPFEENCLEFYNNKRSIHTLSANQVKTPIYRTAINSWKNYESAMSVVKEKLEH